MTYLYRYKNLKAIYARDQNGLIGYVDGNGKGRMPWSGQKADLDFLRSTIYGNNVIIGRKTYEGIPSGFLRDVNRVIVVSSEEGCHKMSDLLGEVKAYPDEEFFILGGLSVFKWAVNYASVFYETRFNFECTIPKDFHPIYFDITGFVFNIEKSIPVRINSMNGTLYIHYMRKDD